MLPVQARAQQDSTGKFQAQGYFSFLETIIDAGSPHGYWQYETMFQNRLNLYYLPSSSFSFSLQARNRFITGDRFRTDPFDANKKMLATDPGMLDLSFNLARGPSYVIHTDIDRLWAKYTAANLVITAGRQRVNWGLTYVWNPNDWFNNYSYFDVDYPERPGSDAIRLQYFAGAVSGAELAVKSDSAGKVTLAGMYKTNFGGYDLQLIGGILSSRDAGIGMGWAGSIGSVGFRGEAGYFHPVRNFSDTSGQFLASLSLDYTFPNSLMIQAEGLYCQQPEGAKRNSFLDFYQRPLTVRDLSFTDWNLFLQGSWPVFPLVNISLAGMYFPRINGFFVGPSATFSIGDNLDASFFVQWFEGDTGVALRSSYTFGYFQIKFSF